MTYTYDDSKYLHWYMHLYLWYIRILMHILVMVFYTYSVRFVYLFKLNLWVCASILSISYHYGPLSL